MRKFLLLLPILLASCATIITGRNKVVRFGAEGNSYDSVEVEIESSDFVQRVKLPSAVNIKKSHSPITITVKDKCYKELNHVRKSKINPIVLGNLIIGGIPGTVTDAATGSMWTYDDMINVPVVSNGTCN